MTVAATDAEEAGFAEHQVVVFAAVGKGFEADSVGCAGRGRGCGGAGVSAGEGGAAGGVCCVGRRRRGKVKEEVCIIGVCGEDGGAPEEALSGAEVVGRGMRGFCKVGAEELDRTILYSVSYPIIIVLQRDSQSEDIHTPPSPSFTTST